MGADLRAAGLKILGTLGSAEGGAAAYMARALPLLTIPVFLFSAALTLVHGGSFFGVSGQDQVTDYLLFVAQLCVSPTLTTIVIGALVWVMQRAGAVDPVIVGLTTAILIVLSGLTTRLLWLVDDVWLYFIATVVLMTWLRKDGWSKALLMVVVLLGLHYIAMLAGNTVLGLLSGRFLR